MAHWRTMMEPREYIYAEDLQGRDRTLTIERVKQGELKGEKGRKTRKPLVFFKGAKKPLAINITNAKALERIAGSGDMDKWVGLTITLFESTTNDPNGNQVPCVRIRPRPGKASEASGMRDPDPPPDEPPHDDMPEPGSEG